MIPSEILIPFIVAVVSAALFSWINIKIKFAPTEAHAKKDVRRIFLFVLGVIQWLAFAYLLWWVVMQFISDAPISARKLLWILLAAFGLFHTYMMVWIMMVVQITGKLAEVGRKHAALTFDILEREKKARQKGGVV